MVKSELRQYSIKIWDGFANKYSMDGNNDDPVKSRKCPRIVIPVKTGIQRF
jgi:hypothetical protein